MDLTATNSVRVCFTTSSVTAMDVEIEGEQEVEGEQDVYIEGKQEGHCLGHVGE